MTNVIDEKQIEAWHSSGVITQDQAARMLLDVIESGQDKKSGGFVAAIVALGAILCGTGAILFVAWNWSAITDGLKIMLLASVTFAAYYAGYVFAYEKANRPRTGAALIFLGAVLFGVSILVVAQAFSIRLKDEALYTILGLWLVGILPIVYGFRSKVTAMLASVLFFALVYVVYRTEVSRGDLFSSYSRSGINMLIAGILSAAVLFGIGGLHYISEKLQPIGRIYRLAGFHLCMFIMLMLSTRFMYDMYRYKQVFPITEKVFAWVACFGVLAIALSVANVLLRTRRGNIFGLENVALLIVSVFTMLFFFGVSSETAKVFQLMFAIAFAGVAFMALYVGYERMDMSLVNKAGVWILVFIVVKYFEWFVEARANPYLLFIFGGIGLILVGSFLERKRKEIRKAFLLRQSQSYAQ